MLKRSGYNVVQAIDADDALEQLENLVPDLIMTDIQLPGMDGLELTRILRARDAFDKTPIIVLSAFQSATMIQDALDAGADEFFKKPLQMAGLSDTLNAIIDKKRNE